MSQAPSSTQNPGSIPFTIRGYDHIKVALSDIPAFERVLKVFGFSPIQESPAFLQKPESIWGSGDAFFCLYSPTHPVAKKHFDLHGDTVFDLSFIVDSHAEHSMVYEGVGQMKHTLIRQKTFATMPSPRGILRFDHNTLNVEKGKLSEAVDTYMKNFGFQKGQYFDIKGAHTGLYSWVTRAPNFTVQIPFNEAADAKSQIQEYINIHRGPGVQHIALLSSNIIQTMDAVQNEPNPPTKFLDVPDTYYELVQKRVKIKEPVKELERLRILADQDEKGYLLQIFTQNIFGGFFFELIQRHGNEGFGEGNFQALFESIELDQKRRGVL